MGGGQAWSMRFWEAILAGSIPVVRSADFDMGSSMVWSVLAVGYHFIELDKGDKLVYDESLVQSNLDKFLRYQTWMKGDHTPPNISKPEHYWRVDKDEVLYDSTFEIPLGC